MGDCFWNVVLRDRIRNFGMICACFLICFLVPVTVKAGENVTGGASFEEATEIQWEKEYTTTNAEGWFKVYAPENMIYIGAGYDDFTEISACTSNKGYLYQSDRLYKRVNLGEQTEYWDTDFFKCIAPNLTGNAYYYFKVKSTKADTCTFKLICGSRYSEKNRAAIQFNQNYSDLYYVQDPNIYGSHYSSHYEFVAANSGNYKIILNSQNGKGKCSITYKDGTSVVYCLECEKNQTVEKVFSVQQGVTYYLETWWAPDETKDMERPIDITFQVSNARVSLITLNSTSLSMNKGDQFHLAANVQPENAVDKTVTFSTSNANVAAVSENGIVTAVHGGTAVISANANDGSGVQAFCQITVIPKLVTRLELNGDYIEEDLEAFDDENYYYQLKATTYPSDADDGSVTYASSNSSIVSVNRQSGKLTLKKPGTATIICKTNDGSNLTRTCKVVVKKSHFSGEKKTINKIKYRVTSDTSGGGTVAVYGVSDKNAKSYTIQNSVTIDGYTYKVTEISSKAFANCKKAAGIVLGTNMKSIGKEAFMNCRKLKTLTIKSKKLKTVGKNALKGIYSKATIKVPSSSLSKYKKLFKGKGQKTSVKIKKI